MSDHDIDELTENDRGRYRVHTHTSYYDFDLDLGTVTRHPGPTAPPTINDGMKPGTIQTPVFLPPGHRRGAASARDSRSASFGSRAYRHSLDRPPSH